MDDYERFPIEIDEYGNLTRGGGFEEYLRQEQPYKFKPIVLDFSDTPMCEDANEFYDWILIKFSAVLTSRDRNYVEQSCKAIVEEGNRRTELLINEIGLAQTIRLKEGEKHNGGICLPEFHGQIQHAISWKSVRLITLLVPAEVTDIRIISPKKVVPVQFIPSQTGVLRSGQPTLQEEVQTEHIGTANQSVSDFLADIDNEEE